MAKAFETIGHRETVERLRALRAQALRDIDGQLLRDVKGEPNDLGPALARLEQVDKDIRREEVRAMQAWHRADAAEAGEPVPEVLDPAKGSRAAIRADAIGFIGRAIVVLSQRAGHADFYPPCALHLREALDAVRAGRYEEAMAATESALAAEGITPLDRGGVPTRWELAADLVDLATRHVRFA